MIRFFYTLLLALFSPLLLSSLYKKKEGKPPFGPRWKEHFGITPPLSTTSRPVWIHAVSVGEVIAATPIIKALKEQNPEQTILVTTTTSTGAEQIEKLGDLVEHRYMPIDFSFAVRGFLNATKPEKMLIMETELWPNTLHTVAKFGIPISVLNARLSEKSFLGYKKVQPIFNLLGKYLTHVCCQYQDDADRFIALGIDESRVHVTGSVKFDIEITDEVIESGKRLRCELGAKRPIWIAASTHQGEDEQVLAAHQKLLKSIPDALLILVPRHPERFTSVLNLCKASGLNTVKRTTVQSVTSDIQVYIGDTMGEMSTLIAAADVCFMGGSLLGNKVGGHNVLEPVALGVPIVTGPSYFNFTHIIEKLLKQEAIKVASSHEEIQKYINELLIKEESRSNLRHIYKGFINNELGAISKTILIINKE